MRRREFEVTGSQFPKSRWPIWAGVFWEIGKSVPVTISQFPNFPNSAEPDGLGSFGKLGNLYL